MSDNFYEAQINNLNFRYNGGNIIEVHETPHPPNAENRLTGKPTTENPLSAKPMSEKQTQLNDNRITN
jgi:hypothetical protein